MRARQKSSASLSQRSSAIANQVSGPLIPLTERLEARLHSLALTIGGHDFSMAAHFAVVRPESGYGPDSTTPGSAP